MHKKGLALLAIILIFQAPFAYAFQMKVGIFTDIKSRKLMVKIDSGVYDIYSGSDRITEISEEDKIELFYGSSNVRLYINNQAQGTYTTLNFKCNQSYGTFKLTSKEPFKESRIYADNLEVDASAHYLKTVNNIELNKYVAGVVESEIGHVKNEELLKVQAIACRTYAMKNMAKHKKNGYNVCDRTHCQVYNGKPRFNPLIRSAIVASGNFIIVDTLDNKPILALFHSNCGGQTTTTDYVWNYNIPYLQSVKDTFCLNQKHATWSKVLTSNQWSSYLNRKAGISISDTILDSIYSRKRELRFKEHSIVLTDIREDLKLNSTYFTINKFNEEVILLGKGFGHGVGMCQEGAIHMAELGYCYPDIIKFYYRGVKIVDYTTWSSGGK